MEMTDNTYTLHKCQWLVQSKAHSLQNFYME